MPSQLKKTGSQSGRPTGAQTTSTQQTHLRPSLSASGEKRQNSASALCSGFAHELLSESEINPAKHDVYRICRCVLRQRYYSKGCMEYQNLCRTRTKGNHPGKQIASHPGMLCGVSGISSASCSGVAVSALHSASMHVRLIHRTGPSCDAQVHLIPAPANFAVSTICPACRWVCSAQWTNNPPTVVGSRLRPIPRGSS
jgi:hypothetical protein